MTLREKIAAEIGNVPTSNELCLTIADRVLDLMTDEYGLNRNVLDAISELVQLRAEVVDLRGFHRMAQEHRDEALRENERLRIENVRETVEDADRAVSAALGADAIVDACADLAHENLASQAKSLWKGVSKEHSDILSGAMAELIPRMRALKGKFVLKP